MKFLSLQPKNNLKNQIRNSSLKSNSQTDNIFTSLFHRSSKIVIPILKNNENVPKTKMEFKFSQFPPKININTLEYIDSESRNMDGKNGYKVYFNL